MTTVDPDTLAVDPQVLRDIGRRFGGRLALNADVSRPGRIAVGDSSVGLDDPDVGFRAGRAVQIGAPVGARARTFLVDGGTGIDDLDTVRVRDIVS